MLLTKNISINYTSSLFVLRYFALVFLTSSSQQGCLLSWIAAT